MGGKEDPLGWQGRTVDGRIEIERLVGEGGFALVYRGRHLGFDEPVAVKFLKLPAALGDADREAFLADFRAEAKLLHKLSRKHVAIVQALDVGAAVSPSGTWTPYIVMEWIDGKSLERDVADRAEEGKRRRTLAEAIALMTPVAEALGVAHIERVAHLDVKPGNIFLANDGATKLLDFGIAKVLTGSDPVTRALTQTGNMTAFTPGYGAPEQFNRLHGGTGPWTDVFALGLVLVELCTGEEALVGDTPLQLYIAAANEQSRPSFAAHGLRVSQEVENVMRRAFEVEPRRRFPDANAMWQALETASRSDQFLAPSHGHTVGAQSLAPGSLAPVSVVPVSMMPAHASVSGPSVTAKTARSDLALPTGQNRVCTVLFAELAGSNPDDDLDPEELTDVLERCMGAWIEAVSATGGAIERVVGDSLMALFGLYDDSASAAERAVHAALRMRAVLQEMDRPRGLHAPIELVARVGVSTGRVFVSARQSTGGFRLGVTGTPAKRAARLQQLAPPGGILVDHHSYRHVAGIFEAELVEMPPARTRTATESRAYRIVGVGRDRHALSVHAVRDFCGLATRFVGREAEMQALLAAVDTAAGEPCSRFVTLLGTAGVGKSRILVELAERLEAQEWLVFAAQGSALLRKSSYALASALLRAKFHIHEDDAVDVATAKLHRGVRLLGGWTTLEVGRSPHDLASFDAEGFVDLDELVAQLLHLLGMHAPGDALLGTEEGAAVKQRIAAAMGALCRVARAPIAILCDELQWADDASLDLLDDLCVRLGDRPILVVAAARPELIERRPLWGEGEHIHQRVSVGAMTRRQLEQMARDRLHRVAALPDDLVRRLSDHADGSPLTLVETLHLLVDVGAIFTSPNQWTLAPDRLGDLTLPVTVQGVVQARLDRLDPASRDLLARAAVVGRTFWDGALLESGGDGDAVFTRRLLGELRDRGLVRARQRSTFPDHQELVFAESTTHRVAYEMLSRNERQALHRRVATWLEARTPNDAGAALVAGHYERGRAFPEAAAAYRRAGFHASRLGQNAEALHAFERACRIEDFLAGEDGIDAGTGEICEGVVELADARVASWPSRVALRAEMGDVLRRMGRFDEAETRYGEARACIVSVERRQNEPVHALEGLRWEARLGYRAAMLERLRGNVAAALELVEGALELGERARLTDELAEMRSVYAALLLRQGRVAECRSACLLGLRACRRAEERGDRWRHAVSNLLNALGGMFYRSGKLIQAERCYLQALRAIDARRNPDQASQALNNVAATRYARGDIEGARSCFQDVLRLTERSGDLWMKMTALANLGEVELARNQASFARTCLVEAIRLGEQIRAELDLADVYRNLAKAEAVLGEPVRGLDAAERALELVRAAETSVYLPAVLVTVAEIAAAARGASEPQRSRGASLAGAVLALIDREAVPEATRMRCREILPT
jgi:serine/threonine protein kinase/tetratricopeptide (TPR) repeat protein